MKKFISPALVYLCLLLFLMVCGTNLWLYLSHVERINGALDSNLNNRVNRIADISGYYIVHYEYELLNKLVLDTGNYEDVLFISIKDEHGDVAFQSGLRDDNKSRYHSGIIEYQEKHVGLVELSVKDDQLKDELRESLVKSIALLVVTLSLFGWVFFFFILSQVMERKALVADYANRAKSEFLSQMSHDLRTPLNAIIGFAQIMQYNSREPLTEDQSSSVEHILEGGRHLLKLINEVLDLSKIDAGKVEMQYENVSIALALDECLTLVGSMAEKQGIEMIVDENFKTAPLIYADYTRLKQILLNLISNGIKYNNKNGKLFFACQETSAKMLYFSVTDTGQGISKQNISGLFEPFNRLEAEKTTIQGTGIGLTITKKLTESMGGRIGVSSELGKGTKFWVELPLAK